MSNKEILSELRTIPELLRRTVELFPEREAFRQYDYQANAWISTTWEEFYAGVMRWRRAFHAMGLVPGDRAAMLLTNCLDAVTFDEAALSSGLIPVPLHAIDTAHSSAYILKDSNAKFLVTTSRARWNAIHAADPQLSDLQQIVFTNEVGDELVDGIRLSGLEAWLAKGNSVSDDELFAGPALEDTAGFIYTSGTTGRPKGVMITHANIASNIQQINDSFNFTEEDVFLSYLPFSHTFERMVAHYVSVAHGSAMAFVRSVNRIEDDLAEVKPTLMCSVPRVFERLYQKIQTDLAKSSEDERHKTEWACEVGWRKFCRANGLSVEHTDREAMDATVAKMLDEEVGSRIREVFGGRLRACFAGGASLNLMVSRFFNSFSIPVLQLYGLTETSPIVSFTRMGRNNPQCVGFPVVGTEVRLGENDELQVKGPQVMKGYWRKPKETAAAFTEDGWFKTGDQADITEEGFIRIKGRIKEIIVTSTGEKISPVDLEFAIQEDHLFSQVFVLGDNRPFITALVVVDEHHWGEICRDMQLDPEDPKTLKNRDLLRLVVKRVRAAAKNFPSYGIPRSVEILREPFTVEDGLLTTTMKLKRPQILERYKDQIDEMYAGHKNA